MLEVVAEAGAPRRELEVVMADIQPETPQEVRAAIAEASSAAEQQARPRCTARPGSKQARLTSHRRLQLGKVATRGRMPG